MPFLRNAWYVAATSEEVTRTPMARTLLGDPVMLYRTQAGGAAALSDKCPHRFAPMHLGRLDGDVIACPYHGLGFDEQGQCVLNPHGDITPPNARLRRYPSLERQGMVWLWFGDADPDFASMPDFIELDSDEGRRTIGGYMSVRAHFSLAIDNLLDLTHSGYLHGGSVSVPATDALPVATSGIDESGVFSKFVTSNVHAPGHWRKTWGERLCDYHRLVLWSAPSRVTTQIGCSPPDEPIEHGLSTIARHLLTPETDRSSHYFWRHTRTHDLDPQGDEHIRRFIEKAFVTEDEPMIAACQEYMGTADLFSLRPVILPTDRASVLVHRTLAKLQHEENVSKQKVPNLTGGEVCQT